MYKKEIWVDFKEFIEYILVRVFEIIFIIIKLFVDNCFNMFYCMNNVYNVRYNVFR